MKSTTNGLFHLCEDGFRRVSRLASTESYGRTGRRRERQKRHARCAPQLSTRQTLLKVIWKPMITAARTHSSRGFSEVKDRRELELSAERTCKGASSSRG